MYPSSRSYAEQYRKVGATSSILEASPHKLVQLLLEGASTRVRMAMACLERGDQAGKGKAIGRTSDIIGHLAGTLDMEKGGELAQNLAALYDYIQMRLTHGHLHNDRAAFEEVLSLIGEIESAWSSIAHTTAEAPTP